MKEKLVYQRKDGRWEARYKKGVSQEGKTLYGAVYGSTKEEVLKRRSLITGAPNAAEISSPRDHFPSRAPARRHRMHHPRTPGTYRL